MHKAYVQDRSIGSSYYGIKDAKTLNAMCQYWARIENIMAGRLLGDSHKSGDYYGYIPFPDEDFVKMLEKIKEIVGEETFKDKRFLDIGCGLGAKVWLAHEAGLYASGIELSKGYAEMAKEIFKHRHKIEIKKADGLRFKDYNKYDIIYMYSPCSNGLKMQNLVERVVKNMKVGAFVIGSFNAEPVRRVNEQFKHHSSGVYQKLS